MTLISDKSESIRKLGLNLCKKKTNHKKNIKSLDPVSPTPSRIKSKIASSSQLSSKPPSFPALPQNSRTKLMAPSASVKEKASGESER